MSSCGLGCPQRRASTCLRRRRPGSRAARIRTGPRDTGKREPGVRQGRPRRRRQSARPPCQFSTSDCALISNVGKRPQEFEAAARSASGAAGAEAQVRDYWKPVISTSADGNQHRQVLLPRRDLVTYFARSTIEWHMSVSSRGAREPGIATNVAGHQGLATKSAIG